MTDKKKHSVLIVAATILLSLASSAYAQIMPSQDAYTNSPWPTTNYGTAVTLDTVRIEGPPEHSRTRLASVLYALGAGNAATAGGLPLPAFK